MNSLNHSVALGPVSLSLAQLIVVTALLVALVVGALLGRRRGVAVSDALFNAVILGVIGARAGFVIQYYASFDSFTGMLDIRDGGFSLVGGLVVGLASIGWTLWRHTEKRGALAGAALAGFLAWGMPTGAIKLIDEHARPAPDVPLATLKGGTTSLPDMIESQGRPLVVNIWASWCPPCRREMPVLEQAQQTQDEFTFAFVNHGEQPSVIRGFLDDESLALQNVLMDTSGSLSSATGSVGLPTTLYYNAEGQLVDTHFGELSKASLQRGLDRLTDD